MLLAATTRAEDAEADHAKMVFFESKVRPLLAEHCWSCHGEEKQRGGLRLDSLTGVAAGGESGPSLDQDDPPASLLLEAVRYESFEMPPSGQLDTKQIAILEQWVEMGTPWPGQAVDSEAIAMKDAAQDKISQEDRQWWAIQPLAVPPIPDVSTAPPDWQNNPIDAFIFAAMRDQRLAPAPQEDRVKLARRLFFDLVGMPPTAEQMEAFLADQSPGAYERLVDQLLNSPQYGERWARHWLDLVRYADSDGYRIDHYRPNAWRYRQWVIDSLNADKPYDRFVQEQIAGDELFPDDPQALVATGYLRHWIYEYNNRDAIGQWQTIIEDVTDTTGDVFLGIGMQCAKCHDHKFDPISQRDYFRLQAFLSGILPEDATVETPQERAEYERALAKWERATEQLRQQLEVILSKYRPKAETTAVEKFPEEVQRIYNKPADEQTPWEKQIAYLVWRQVEFEYDRMDSKLSSDDKEKVIELRRQIAEFDSLKPAPLPVAQTVRDVGRQAPETVMPKRSKEPIEPGFLTILDPGEAQIDPPQGRSTSGRRAALARWMTRPDNPLTTRVIANRVWQYHLGRGLAANGSDFGQLGGPPSHPELLDWLATYLVDNGWRLKSLHRLIVNSATYRQATRHPQYVDQQAIDPQNRYYWRSGARRLDAEQIRDAMLAVSGQLKPQPGGPGVVADQPRRTICTRVMRNQRDPLLDAFDLPAFFSSESSRNTTTTPVQSLMLLNSPQLVKMAESLAKRLGDPDDGDELLVERLWRLAYSRAPEPAETDAALDFLQSQRELIAAGPSESELGQFDLGKMAYRDGQSVSISPDSNQPILAVADRPELKLSDFTVEAFIQPRTIYSSGSVRTVVSKWSGKSGKPGWAFGITGKGSRRKPQTLVLQLWGKKVDGSFGEAAIFSDHHLEMNKPYFIGAAVTLARLATEGEAARQGKITFYVKDLANDDEPLLVAEMPHQIVDGFDNDLPLIIGGRGDGSGVYDGLVDSVRLSRSVLHEGQLLFTNESVATTTLAYWRLESDPGLRRDSSPGGLDLVQTHRSSIATDPRSGALIDLCHAVLNSNEFLYSP